MIRTLDQIVSSKVEPVGSIFAETDGGLYIPLYQRYYAWEEKQFYDLVNAITDVLNRPAEISDEKFDKYSHLFGSAIFFDDREGKYVYPKSDEFLLTKVTNVVDGQQRITTLALLATLINKDLAHESNIINKVGLPENKIKELTQIKDKTMNKLENFYILDLPNCKVPKIIRMLDDEWDVLARPESYKSPVAKYIHMCINHENYEDCHVVEILRELGSEHEIFANKLESLVKIYKSFVLQEGSSKISKLNDIPTIFLNKKIMRKIFQYPLTGILLENENKEYHSFLRKLILGNFIQHCLYCVNVIVTEDYERAFSIFETLNTTGKLLTPFECLKPEIVASAKNDEKNDLSKLEENNKIILMQDIEDLLTDIALKPMDRETAEQTIVYIFLLVLSGAAAPKNMAVQRSELKDRFNSMKKERVNDGQTEKDEFDNQVEFLLLFKAVTEVYKMYIYETLTVSIRSSENEQIKLLEDEASLCLGYLKESNCKLGLAPISRYYYEMLKPCDEDRDKIFKEGLVEGFYKSITSTAALFALWNTIPDKRPKSEKPSRASSVDEVFHGIFNQRQCHFDISLFDFYLRKLKEISDVVYLAKYYQIEVMKLMKVISKKAWIEQLRSHPIYSKQKRTAKFLLLLHYIWVTKQQSNKHEEESSAERMTKIKIDDPYKDENYMNLVQIIFPHELAKSHEYFDQLWNLALVDKDTKGFVQVLSQAEIKKLYDHIVTLTEEQLEELYGYKDESNDIHIDESYALKIKSLIEKSEIDAAARVALSRCTPILELSWNKLARDWLEWSPHLY